MPKMKTKRGAAKRFRVTGTGKVKRAHAYRRHILTSKVRKVKKHLGKSAIVHPADEANIKKLIPFM